MSLLPYSREDVVAGIEKHQPQTESRLRILFANEVINESNFEKACRLYANLKGTNYDTVVIVERFLNGNDKLLPMTSKPYFITPFGEVAVNDALRNEFCDEDDDFFIDDSGFSEKMHLYNHLMMLQCTLDHFEVLSIQMADQGTSIVWELASALSELLRDRNVLVVVLSNIDNSDHTSLKKLGELVEKKADSELLNFLQSGEAGLLGAGPFAAGILVSKEWELKNQLDLQANGSSTFLAGCAHLSGYKTPVVI